MTVARRTVLLQIVVSVAALAAVVWWASRQHLPALPDTDHALGGLVAALGLYALATLARGERWHRSHAPVGRRERGVVTVSGQRIFHGRAAGISPAEERRRWVLPDSRLR